MSFVFSADESRDSSELRYRVVAHSGAGHPTGPTMKVNLRGLVQHCELFRRLVHDTPAQFVLDANTEGVRGRCYPDLLRKCLTMRNLQRLVLLGNNPRAFIRALPPSRAAHKEAKPAGKPSPIPEQPHPPTLSQNELFAELDVLRSKVGGVLRHRVGKKRCCPDYVALIACCFCMVCVCFVGATRGAAALGRAYASGIRLFCRCDRRQGWARHPEARLRLTSVRRRHCPQRSDSTNLMRGHDSRSHAHGTGVPPCCRSTACHRRVRLRGWQGWRRFRRHT